MQTLKIILIFLLILLSSCNGVNKYPSINFIGGKGIISQDAVLKKNSDFKIGINSYSNSDFQLYKFKLIRVFDNNPQIVIDSIINSNNFNAILTCPTSENESVERWIFSITSTDGYTSEISVQITSSDTLINKESGDNFIKNYVIEDLPNDLKYHYMIYGLLIVLIILLMIRKKRIKEVKNKQIDLKEKSNNNNNLYVIISVIFLLAFIAKLAYDNLFL